MIRKLNREMSPEKEAYIRQVIKKTKELGHEICIHNDYKPSIDWRKEKKEYEKRLEEFNLDKEDLGRTVLYLLDVVPDYRYWPTLFGNNSCTWYKVVDFDISIIDTDNNVWVRIYIDHTDDDYTTKDNPAFEKEPDEEELEEVLNRPLYQTLRELDGRVRCKAEEIEQAFIQTLGRDSVTVRDLCNNFTKVYYASGVGRHIGGEIYDYLVDLGIPKDKIRN